MSTVKPSKNKFLKQKLTLINAFDSHVHFLATGQVQFELLLQNLTKPSQLKTLLTPHIEYRNNWLIGFGWNENNFEDKEVLNLSLLDQLFPDHPVFLSRVDGHASVLNTKALEELLKLGFSLASYEEPFVTYETRGPGQKIFTGLLKDQAHIDALLKLPPFTEEQLKKFLIKAGQIFNEGGFTHVRDLSMTYQQWCLQKELAESQKLQIYSEGFVTVENVADLARGFNQVQLCQKNPSRYLKMKGLKIFIDGSLGSETAYLSVPYLNSSKNGVLLWSQKNIQEAIAFCWKNKIEIAIHAIGDEAVHTAALAAREVSAQGYLGKFHIEHAELLRPDTLQILKPLHVTVHMQPCHLLSDQIWIKSKLGDHAKHLMRWEMLRKNKIKLDFGTDSPIEPSQLVKNLQSLDQCHELNIEPLQDNIENYHTYAGWGECTTVINAGVIESVTFG